MAANEPNQITVRVLKYDGTGYRRWNACKARREGSLIVLDAEFESDVEHELLGHIERGTPTTEFYWLDRWYNVFCLFEKSGDLKCYYCNINTPPTFDGSVLSYVDLDIDILVQPDLSYEVLDLDEFEKTAARLKYSDATRASAQKALRELISMIETRQFPFTEDTLGPSVSSMVN